MKNYVVTNVRLPKEVFQELKLRAVREHKPFAALIREAIEHTFGLAGKPSLDAKAFHAQLMNLCALGGSHDPHNADRVDAIYDEP